MDGVELSASSTSARRRASATRSRTRAPTSRPTWSGTGIVASVTNPPPDDGEQEAGGGRSPHRLYNIGNNRLEELDHMTALIEQACGRAAVRDLQPIQPGGFPDTYAAIAAIQRDMGFKPTTTIEAGVPRFVDWFRDYHRI